MKRHVVLITLLLLAAAPAFAQETEEDLLRALGMGAVFGGGNLAVKDIDRGNDPVQQLKRFFNENKLPLTKSQESRLNAIIDAQRKMMHSAPQDDDALRKTNIDFMRKVIGVLTQEQQTTWRRYRTEQIMLRGGFDAVQLIMEEAKVPLTAAQEKEISAIYTEFDKQVEQINKDSGGKPDRAALDKLENGALAKIVAHLQAPQRQALRKRRTVGGRGY